MCPPVAKKQLVLFPTRYRRIPSVASLNNDFSFSNDAVFVFRNRRGVVDARWFDASSVFVHISVSNRSAIGNWDFKERLVLGPRPSLIWPIRKIVSICHVNIFVDFLKVRILVDAWTALGSFSQPIRVKVPGVEPFIEINDNDNQEGSSGVTCCWVNEFARQRGKGMLNDSRIGAD